jgi:hypothetical protein
MLSRASGTTSSSLKPGGGRHHGVQLERLDARGLGRGNAVPDPPQIAPAGDAAKLGRVQGVDADVQPAQASPRQRLGQLGQQQAVGGHGHLLDARRGHDGPHQLHHTGPDGRLAAGQTDLGDAQAGRHAHNCQQLVVAQQLSPRPKAHLFGHAVDTAQIARIGQRDAQVVDAASEAIAQRPGVARRRLVPGLGGSQVNRRPHGVPSPDHSYAGEGSR